MGIAIAVVLVVIAAALFLAARKGWIANQTIQLLTNVASVVAVIAAIVVIVFPPPYQAPTATPTATATAAPPPTTGAAVLVQITTSKGVLQPNEQTNLTVRVDPPLPAATFRWSADIGSIDEADWTVKSTVTFTGPPFTGLATVFVQVRDATGKSVGHAELAIPLAKGESTPTTAVTQATAPTNSPQVTQPSPTSTPNPYASQGDCGSNLPPCTYKIKTNDSYMLIATLFYGTRSQAPTIMNLNRDQHGNIKNLYPDDFVYVPAPGAIPPLDYPQCNGTIFPCLYKAKPGETYQSIAQSLYGHANAAALIMQANQLSYDGQSQAVNPVDVHENQILVLPAEP